MLMMWAAFLAAIPLQNGAFTDGLAGWKVHRHGSSGYAPIIRVETAPPSILIDSHDAGAGGVEQTVYSTPGSLLRLTARIRSEAAGLIQIHTSSGIVGQATFGGADGAWNAHEITFRVPSPGEVEIHLDNAAEGSAPVSGKVWFADLHIQKLTEPDAGEVRILLNHAGKRPIDAKQQGQFIEYLCRLVPSMLAQQVDNGDFEEEPPYRFSYKQQIDHPHRPWYEDGAVHVADYSYETNDPFSGKRSQKIVIPIPTVHAGIAQDGYYLKARLRYRLRLHAKTEGEIQGRAVLRDSSGVLAEAPLPRLTNTWKPSEVILTATRSSPAATLALDFEGPGTVWLDRVYLIGEDAVLRLWRSDVVEALKQLKPGVIRFGGTSVEGYEWEKTIGNWDTRVPFTTYWGGLEPNFVGLDEFVQLCRYVGAEPLICLRWTGKMPVDAAAEVEYLNGSPDTRWGSVRARNGHAEPYRVKYWQIGNEVGGPEYTRSIADFARAMRAVDPTIKLLSSYPSSDTLALAGEWLDYLAPHHYDFGDLTDIARQFDLFRDQIRQGANGRDIRVAVTEWNTTGGEFGLKRGTLQTLGNALSCSRYHNLMLRNADLVEMGIRSNLIDSFGSGILITGPGWLYLAPTYYAEQLYQRAAGSYPVSVERDLQLAWQLREPDVSAAISPDGRTLRIYAVNSTAAVLTPAFTLANAAKPPLKMLVTVLKDSAAKPDSEAMNSVDAPHRVTAHTHTDTHTVGNHFRVPLDPYSLTVLELSLAP